MPSLLRRLRDDNTDSVMGERAARDLAGDLLQQWRHERTRLDTIDRYLRGDQDKPYIPREAKAEYTLLARRAVTNLCPLITTETVQQLRVDGYRRKDDAENLLPWLFWQANGLDSRQLPLYGAALNYGLAYEIVLPGDRPVADDQGNMWQAPNIRGLSPREMFAAYGDPAWDDFPMAALRVKPAGDRYALELYDEAAVYYLAADGHAGGPPEMFSYETHGMGVCPAVKFADMPDLEGRVTGQVEPYITLQDRVNQDVFDRLLTQTYSSFKIRTATGMAVEKDSDGNPVKPVDLARDRMLVSRSKETEFGSLEESPISPFLESEEQDVRRMATISQTPPTSLLGHITNMTAESLVVARMGADNKADDRKMVYGEAHEQKLRLAAHAAGDPESAADVQAEVQWKDMGARALAQLADAFTKLASEDGLDLPPEILWEKLPFLTQTDVERAKDMKREADRLGQVMERIAGQIEAGDVED